MWRMGVWTGALLSSLPWLAVGEDPPRWLAPKEITTPGASPIVKSHLCFAEENDPRFHWPFYCSCMEECVGWTRYEGVFAPVYTNMLERCRGAGYMDPVELDEIVMNTGYCPMDWVRCEAQCLHCAGCTIEEFVPWCENRLAYWGAFFEVPTTGEDWPTKLGAGICYQSLCSEWCQAGPHDIILYTFIGIAGLNVLCAAIYVARLKLGPRRPTPLNILDVYDKYKDQHKIDDEDQMDRHINNMGGVNADFYKVVQFAKEQDELALIYVPKDPNEEKAEVVGMVEDGRHGFLPVFYPSDAPIIDEGNRPEYKEATNTQVYILRFG